MSVWVAFWKLIVWRTYAHQPPSNLITSSARRKLCINLDDYYAVVFINAQRGFVCISHTFQWSNVLCFPKTKQIFSVELMYFNMEKASKMLKIQYCIYFCRPQCFQRKWYGEQWLAATSINPLVAYQIFSWFPFRQVPDEFPTSYIYIWLYLFHFIGCEPFGCCWCCEFISFFFLLLLFLSTKLAILFVDSNERNETRNVIIFTCHECSKCKAPKLES